MSENQETPQSDLLPPDVLGDREEKREERIEAGSDPGPRSSVETAPDQAPPPGSS